MTTSVLAPTTVGAPYRAQDPIAVEIGGVWHEAVVDGIALVQGSTAFGLRWDVLVLVSDEFVWVRVDDNGRRHTYRKQVCPSNRVPEEG